MSESLKLMRDIIHVLFMFSGAAFVSYGWWGMLLLVPTFVLSVWWDGKIANLIGTAMRLAIHPIKDTPQ